MAAPARPPTACPSGPDSKLPTLQVFYHLCRRAKDSILIPHSPNSRGLSPPIWGNHKTKAASYFREEPRGRGIGTGVQHSGVGGNPSPGGTVGARHLLTKRPRCLKHKGREGERVSFWCPFLLPGLRIIPVSFSDFPYLPVSPSQPRRTSLSFKQRPEKQWQGPLH